MINLVVTYNIVNGPRKEFVKEFEKILIEMGLYKESTNQSTYYGPFKSKVDFIGYLLHAVKSLDWDESDIVTIYYPMVRREPDRKLPDIGKLNFKREGSTNFDHIAKKFL